MACFSVDGFGIKILADAFEADTEAWKKAFSEHDSNQWIIIRGILQGGNAMHQQNWLCKCGLVSCFALTLAAQNTTPVQASPQVQTAVEAKPGEQPIKVADHFSKWDYPKEVTVPETCSLHIVEKGDTLWDLGQKFLGNPFAWPQIWELNKWIKDPHWIYPGDPLIVDVKKQVVAKPGVTTADVPKEVQYLRPDRKVWKRPGEMAFTIRDFIQMPFLVKNAEEYFKNAHAFRVKDRQHMERELLGEGEQIYLDAGSDTGAKVGDRLLMQKVVATKLYHPDDTRERNVLGDVIQNAGIIRLIEVNAKGAVAVVEKAMDAIELGDRAVPLTEPANVPIKLRADIQNPIPMKETAKIIYDADRRYIGSIGEMVIIDKGSKDGFQVGDVLLAVRLRNFSVTESKNQPAETSFTNYYLGQLMVVKANEDNATCRILRSVQELIVGDIVTR